MSGDLMSVPRRPTAIDIERMQRSLAMVSAYDMGTSEGEFALFRELVAEEEHPEAQMQSLAQFAWLLLQSMEENGFPKKAVLEWYGAKFAMKHQSLTE